MRQTTLSRSLSRCTVLLLTAALAAAQQPDAARVPESATPAQTTNTVPPAPARQSTSAQKRRAAKLFLSASRLYEAGEFEPALKQYEQAADLDPANQDYAAAAVLARSHAVTALIQSAAKARVENNYADAHAALAHALELDPKNADLAERLRQLADDTVAETAPVRPRPPGIALAAPIELEPAAGTHSFHLRISPQQLVQQVYKAYGINATVDASVTGSVVRFDIDDVGFTEAIRALSLVTQSFAVPIDPHRVLVARNSQALRRQYDRSAVENVSLTGLSQNEMSDIQTVSKSVFEVPRLNLDAHDGVLTLEGSPDTLNAFNNTWTGLSAGRPEVIIDVKVLQIAHTNARNTGVQLPQQITVFNVLSEANSILQANQALVQQIIASGLAGPGDIATILAILLASGQATGSVFNNGFVIFGGNCSLQSGTCSPTAFGLAPGGTTLNLNVNSSDTRQLDNFQFRLLDGEEGTLKAGTRYPITTSTYSNSISSALNIAGLNTAGNSGALSGVLSQLSATPTIPMIQYQDLGLTLKTTPRILRSGDVSLNVDMKILSLAGGSLNGIPVLSNQAYTGVATMRADEAVVIAGEIDSSEVRAVSGTPGLSEIPGLNNVTNKETQKSSATLLIVMTPRVVRLPHGKGATPMQVLEPKAQAR